MATTLTVKQINDLLPASLRDTYRSRIKGLNVHRMRGTCSMAYLEGNDAFFKGISAAEMPRAQAIYESVLSIILFKNRYEGRYYILPHDARQMARTPLLFNTNSRRLAVLYKKVFGYYSNTHVSTCIITFPKQYAGVNNIGIDTADFYLKTLFDTQKLNLTKYA